MHPGTAPQVEGVDVLERIGGTRAQVHRAVVRASGRVVVVKHAPAREHATRAGLRREAAVLGRVRHPALQQLLDVHDGDAGTALVLARHAGGDLAAHVRDHGPLDSASVAALGARVARALAALHAADVVHRDVRASNVLLDAGGRAVLADLDHALDPTTPALAVDGEVVGSRGHLDPRLLDGEPADAASDLHALAVTLWQAATGSLPRRAGGGAGAATPTRPGADVDPTLVDVLQDVLDGESGDARAVADRLADLAGDVAGVVGPAPGRLLSGAAPVAGAGAGAVQRDPSIGGRVEPQSPTSDGPGPADGPSDGLAVAWGDDAGTERFGAPGLPVVQRLRRRLPRWHVVAAVAGLALVPLAAGVVALTGSQDPAPPTVAAAPAAPSTTTDAAPGGPGAVGEGTDAAVGAATGDLGEAVVGGDDQRAAGIPQADVIEPAATLRPSPVVPVPSPPPCPGVVVPTGAVLADVEGSGCGVPLLHDPDTAVLTAADGSRWQLGRPGDVLLVGDWDGDGRWSPGLHRPDAGEVYLFPSLGERATTSAPAQQWPAGGRAVVVEVDGRHDVVVHATP